MNQAAGGFCSASLSPCFSAVSTGHHPKPHSQPFHMTHSHCSLPKLPQAPPAVLPSPATLSSLHKPERPLRRPLSGLSFPCLTAPIISSSPTSPFVFVFSVFNSFSLCFCLDYSSESPTFCCEYFVFQHWSKNKSERPGRIWGQVKEYDQIRLHEKK